MSTVGSMQACAGGLFRGPGIINQGKAYCCDKCADMGQHKVKMLKIMAPEVLGVLGLGAFFGHLFSRRIK